MGCCCCNCEKPSHIFDRIENCDKYAGRNPHFAKAFEFLKRPDLKDLKVGRYEIDGDRVFAMVSEPELKGVEGAKTEVHRKYIDIQAPLKEPEIMGVMTMGEKELALPFDVEKDYALFDAEFRPVTVNPGEFAIFFPPLGAHAPCCTAGKCVRQKKVVIKVLAE